MKIKLHNCNVDGLGQAHAGSLFVTSQATVFQDLSVTCDPSVLHVSHRVPLVS